MPRCSTGCCAWSSNGNQSANCIDNGLRIRTVLNARRNAPPDDLAGSINEKLCRNGHVAAIRGAACVDETILTNHLTIHVAQDGVIQIVALDDLKRPLRRIYGNGQQFSTHSFQCILDISEPAELRYAAKSPMSTIKNQQHRSGRVSRLKRHLPARVIRQFKVRRLSELKRGICRFRQ